MQPLTSWDGVKIGDRFKLLEINRGLMTGLSLGDIVEVVDHNHTGFRMSKVGLMDGYRGTGYVYYPHMVARLVEIKNNEEALSLLLKEE